VELRLDAPEVRKSVARIDETARDQRGDVLEILRVSSA
jgi:hypothetical protein